MKKIITIILGILTIFTLSSCGDQNSIIVGTMSQPGEVILNFIKDDFESKGHKLKIVTFTDFKPINNALAEKSIKANLFQHEPYLNSYNEANNTNLRVAKKLYTAEYGAYTKKGITSVDEIKNNTKVLIANDESNKSRCLYMLNDVGLITLKNIPESKIVNESHIDQNPKNLKITAVSAANIASSLDDEDCYLGIVNATYALTNNLHLTSNMLFSENQEDKMLNANLLAVREEDLNEEWLNDLIDSLTKDETKEFINSYFNGTITTIF